MVDNIRRFEAGPDPFGRTWQVEFRWLQTGISIRHADTVDVKFVLWTADGDEAENQASGGAVQGTDGAPDNAQEKAEKVIALPHPLLLELSRETGHPLTDPWCMRLAARHLREMIETGDDVEKTLVTLKLPAMRKAAGAMQAA
jgi:hypothetical protein